MGLGLDSGALLIFEELESLLEEVESFYGELELTEENLAISLIMGDFSLERRRRCENTKGMKNKGRSFPF